MHLRLFIATAAAVAWVGFAAASAGSEAPAPVDVPYVPKIGRETVPLSEPASTSLAGVRETDAARARPACLDGIVYDDRRFESAFISASICVGCPPGDPGNRHSYVMLFELPHYPARLEKVCIAWGRGAPTGARRVEFDIRVWAADGPDGQPGTLLATIPGFATENLPYYRFPTAGKLYSYDVSGADVVVDGPVYIGPVYYPKLDYVEILWDGSKKTRLRPTYHGLNDEPPSVPPPQPPYRYTYRAFGIRAKFGPP